MITKDPEYYRIASRASYRRRRASILIQKREYYQQHKEDKIAYVIERQRQYPEKIRAKQQVYLALRNGELKKYPCEFCGCIDSEAHHPDYSDRLNVRWLCRYHHRAIERGGLNAIITDA